MKRLMNYAFGLMLGVAAAKAWAGEASTHASADNGWGRNSGTAAATAHYESDSGQGLARTRTETGKVNLARGLAVGFDEDGMDLSFSHAIATRFGPAYAGTFNLSIGRDGEVSGSYGGVLSAGGLARSAEAGGVTRSGPRGSAAQATVGGQANPGGRVQASTNSYNYPARQVVRMAAPVMVRSLRR